MGLFPSIVLFLDTTAAAVEVVVVAAAVVAASSFMFFLRCLRIFLRRSFLTALMFFLVGLLSAASTDGVVRESARRAVRRMA